MLRHFKYFKFLTSLRGNIVLIELMMIVVYFSFTVYTGFTIVVKEGVIVKVVSSTYIKEYNYLCNKLTKIPVINRCEYLLEKKNGFLVNLIFIDTKIIKLNITVFNNAYPSIINDLIKEQKRESFTQENYYNVIIAPFISKESANLCEEANVGYLDMSGNSRLLIGSLFISEQGNQNKFVTKRSSKNIFDPFSKVSSLILRELMGDISIIWKLSHLSKKLQCSIGQVSKVKDYLCERLWAQMTLDGLKILNPKAIMHSWSEAYSQKSTLFNMLDCYTLLSIQEFEDQLRQFRTETEIDCCLTGFAGGVRYTPVVRYNKVHLLIAEKDLQQFLEKSICKQVDSGANVQLHIVSSMEFFYRAQVISNQLIASPVQVYLDCMRLKGRTKEIVEAVFSKEIAK